MIRYLKINTKDYLNKNKLNKMFPTKYVSYFNFLLRCEFEKIFIIYIITNIKIQVTTNTCFLHSSKIIHEFKWNLNGNLLFKFVSSICSYLFQSLFLITPCIIYFSKFCLWRYLSNKESNNLNQ